MPKAIAALSKSWAVTLRLIPTTPQDLDFVLPLEADPDVAPFICGSCREQHERALSSPDEAHFLIADEDGTVGFVMLAGLQNPSHSVELRRIVLARRGAGLGRRALRLILDRAFGTFGAHRVWLDLKLHNERARRCYTVTGFRSEGVLREAMLTNGTYESLEVMSMLAPEWEALR